MSTLPMAVYGLAVPSGDVPITARPDIPAAFRITMAAIDPSAEPEHSDSGAGAQPRATLKLIREPLIPGDDDESDFDEDEMNRMLASDDEDDEEDESEDEDIIGGPSDPAKSKAARKAAAIKQLKADLAAEGMDVDTPNGVKGKGKAAVTDDDDDEDEDEDDDEDDDEFEPEEFVICTLDPSKASRAVLAGTYQQPLDITIGEDERVWFKVSGTHTVYLTGNYVEPAEPPHSHGYDEEDDEDDEYDLSPDEDDLDEDESEDELDDMADPRIMEVGTDDEEAPALVEAPKKAAKADKKGKNKRSAEESADEASTLDDLIAKSAKATDGAANGDAKLSKKQQKKLKNNEGKAVAADASSGAAKEEIPSSAKSDKKVQFAKNLEQGPTPSPAAKKDEGKPKAGLGIKTVNGVKIDDKKLGTGPAAKKGDRVGMRYIGKLKDGKVFDSNKKGKPFSFKLGVGEVIKGWDIGVVGMQVGAERRIIIPAHLAYGSQKLPGIPPNSELTFDIKLIEIK